MQAWELEGQKMQVKELERIAGKIQDGKKLTGFERSFYLTETGDRDYSDADAGETYRGHERETYGRE